MNWFTNLFARHWRNVHLTVISLLIIILIVGQSTVNPFLRQITVGTFYAPFATVKNAFLEYRSVAAENRNLREKLVETSTTLAMYEEAARENVRLRSVLGFEPPAGYSLIPAEIVSVSGEYIPMSAVINKGSSDSLRVDQPVINQQGLIGRISSVSANNAVVQLLTDPANRVAARIAESREMGIIKYSAGSGMMLDNFPIGGDIKVGDLLLSSGLGGVYPSGLKVGTVEEVELPEHEVFAKIKVKPAVNFYSIDELFILKEAGQ
jgi:rod shape-determining protein MreC